MLTSDFGLSLMNFSAVLTISGGDISAVCWRKAVISSLSLVPLTVISFRCEASAFTVAVLPDWAKMGCSE